MARPLRINYEGAVYHVTGRGNERKAIVNDDRDRKKFVQILAAVVDQYDVRCHAWVLMNNHYHLVVETPQANLSGAIRHLNGVYTQAFNRRHERVGHLFQGRFGAILVEKTTYLLEVSRYVVLNPVRAGIVSDPGAWPWSSYRATAGLGRAASWLTIDWLLTHFASHRRLAQEAYRGFIAQGLARDVRLWTELKGRVFLGSDAFVEEARGRIVEPDDPEIPVMQRRPPPPRFADLVDRVADRYGVHAGDLLVRTRRPGQARLVGIYLARRVARLPLRTIAERFGISATSVSRRVAAVERRLAGDESLRAVLNELLKVKGKT